MRVFEELTKHVWPLTVFCLICAGIAAIEFIAMHPSGTPALLTVFCIGFFSAFAIALPLREFTENTRVRKRLFHLTENERIVMDDFARGKITRYRTDPRDECVVDLIADGLVREIRVVSPELHVTSGFVLTARAAKQMKKAYPYSSIRGPK